ncbi:efflux RND transporter periplasmic adaptor subunit [Quisquiliibacterium transsilvanicum]|uniref:RND family efflux transporter MFP subunit n=1 Tax=Quisquiliibacterium transsilvanicum TaxID=1549638 RepID=A0A7W8M7B6_9BURK|nr:efflux RND transporter periplasmic adaptor subunit [Quisquiliibacterium transsilvanicum]MBB5270568.1 RND family efflux transporter MFP subunit [Quisquiliibacterium transsilvanicum]
MSSRRLAAAALTAAMLALSSTPSRVTAADDAPRPIRLTDAQRKALGVEWATPEPAEAGSRTWPATVVAPPSEAQWIATPVTGLLAALKVEANQRVSAGQPLAIVQSPEVAQAIADWRKARSRSLLAQREAVRQRALVDEGVVAPARARQADAEAEQTRADLDAERAHLRLFGLDERALGALPAGAAMPMELTLRAPVSGVVAELPVAAGQRLEAGAAVARVVRTDRLALEIRLPAAEALRLRAGSPVRDTSGRQIGTLGPAPGAVSMAQTVDVRARLAAGAMPWLLGQSVEVRLDTGRSGWRVPRSAVFRLGEAHWVLVERGGSLVPVEIELQAGEGESQVVRGPLDAKARVAAGNVAALKGAVTGLGAPAGETAPGSRP